MRKIKVFFVALMALCCALPSAAQFKYGLEAGLNASKANLDYFSAKNRVGWFVGPKAQFIVPMIGIGVDGAILFSQKYLDIKAHDDEADVDGTIKRTMPYIEIPINLKYNIGFSSLIGAYIATGPQYSWYLGRKSLKSNLEHGRLGSLKTSSFSWNVGLGINALDHLQLGVTYNIALGQTGELDKGVIETAKKIKMKNNTWQVRLAYMF